MTRKDYELIASVLREECAPGHICESLAFEFANKNPRFDIVKFLKACGVS